MQESDEYQKAVENQIVMIEEILSRFAQGMRAWQKTYGVEEWRETTEENIRRHEENLVHFGAERERLHTANWRKSKGQGSARRSRL